MFHRVHFQFYFCKIHNHIKLKLIVTFVKFLLILCSETPIIAHKCFNKDKKKLGKSSECFDKDRVLGEMNFHVIINTTR